MTLYNLLCSSLLATACFSTVSFSQETPSSIPSVKVYQTQVNSLTLHNFSNEVVTVSLYGERLELLPTSGSQFSCQGYDDIAIEFLGIDHDFFEVSCNSRVVIETSFTQQYKE